MVRSRWIYRVLRNFRAGIEADISCLKRAYGLARCTWRGLGHFRAYVWSAVVAYNLALFTRLKPTRRPLPPGTEASPARAGRSPCAHRCVQTGPPPFRGIRSATPLRNRSVGLTSQTRSVQKNSGLWTGT